MQIRTPLPEEEQKLKKIWQICFDTDTDKDIGFYFNNGYKAQNTLVYIESGEPVGMLNIMPVVLNSNGIIYKGGYIYAAATLPEHRHKGILTALEHSACEFAKRHSYDFLCLVPAGSRLVNMYKKLGYIKTSYLSHSIINPLEYNALSIQAQIFKLDKSNYIKLRRDFMNSLDMSIIFDNYAEDYFSRFLDFYGYQNIMIKNKSGQGYITCKKDANRLLIFETDMSSELFCSALRDINKFFKTDKIELYKNADFNSRLSKKPYGMIKPLNERILFPKGINPYMNLMLN